MLLSNQKFTDMHPLGDKQGLCTGCAACAAACAEDSIVMVANSEGFYHPQIDFARCSHCGLCRQSCPVNQKVSPREQSPDACEGVFPRVFAAWHLDETICRESSSGGVFSALAHIFIAQKGVVVGAAFDERLVVRHILVDKDSELHRLRGSKYVQSEIGPDIYRSIREVLQTGRLVLFSGTPCQVAGLYAFLGKDYQNLCTGDIVCHGVPSPKVFYAYKIMMERRCGAKAKRVEFRRKDFGWKRFSVSISFDNGPEYLRVFKEDPFMLTFLRNISLRPSCHSCLFSCLPRVADITLGDFWGVGKHHPEWDNDRGTSLVLVNTEVGSKAFDACRNLLVVHQAELKEAIRANPCICGSVLAGELRGEFFNDLDSLSFEEVKKKYLSLPSYWLTVHGKVRGKFISVVNRLRQIFSN